MICGCSLMAKAPVLQTGYAGSIPVIRSIASKTYFKLEKEEFSYKMG